MMGEFFEGQTDSRLADSVRTLTDGSTTFVKPLEEHMSMGTFLSRLTDGEQEIHYLQSQDGNIYRSTPGARGPPELADFQPFIERDTVWMKEATGYSAEAVNLWIGASRSTTSLHHDPYENIYHVLSGSKTFTLVSPIDGLRIERKFAGFHETDSRTIPSTLDTGQRGERSGSALRRPLSSRCALGGGYRHPSACAAYDSDIERGRFPVPSCKLVASS